jgi:hypothetical protein
MAQDDSDRVHFPKLKPAEPQGSSLLAAERQTASFNPEELSVYMHGRQYLAARESILNILQNDAILGDKSQRIYQGRDERFSQAMRNAKRFAQLIRYVTMYLKCLPSMVAFLTHTYTTRKHKWNAEEILIADMLIDEPNQVRRAHVMVDIASSMSLLICQSASSVSIAQCSYLL